MNTTLTNIKALVTGGSGFIGSHVVDKLIEAKYKVRILDLKLPYQKNVDFIKGDFLSKKHLEKAMKNIDVVYHLGAFADIDLVKGQPVETVRLNILGTAVVLDAARQNGIKRFLYASSVYAHDLHGHIYTTSKISSELLCKNFFTLYGLPYTILRFGTTYGPRSRGVDVISAFVRAAYHKNKIIIHGTGQQVRNFIFVEDLARASVKALKKIAENKTYAIASLQSTSIQKLASMIRKKINNKPKIKIMNLIDKERIDDYKGEISGVQQTINDLNWHPVISLEKGIDKYIDWYLKQL